MSQPSEQPSKVMRIGSMVKQLLEEVGSAPLDDVGRPRLAAIHERSITAREAGLGPERVEERRRVALPFGEDVTPPTPTSTRAVRWAPSCRRWGRSARLDTLEPTLAGVARTA